MAKDDKEKADEKAGGTRLVKYMGSSDERNFKASDNFGGRLQGGLGQDLVFNEANNHVAEVNLDPEAYELFMAQQERDGVGGFIPAFVDVTGKRKVPDNEWQKRWRPQGLTDARQTSAVVNTDEAVSTSGIGEGSTSTTGAGTGAST